MPRRILTVLVILLAVGVAAFALLAWRGDELLRRVLEHQLQQRLVPRLDIAGPVEWRLAPQPMLVVHNVRLSDAGGATLVAVREVVVVGEPVGLSSRSLAVESLQISGVEASLRYRDAGWDAAEWLRPAPLDAAPGVMVPIGRISIADALVHVTGDVAAEFYDLRVEAGPVIHAQPVRIALRSAIVATAPLAARLQLGVATSVRLHEGSTIFDDPQVELRGRVGDWELAQGAGHASRAERATDRTLHATGVAFAFAAQRADSSSPAQAFARPPDVDERPVLLLDGQLSIATLTGEGENWRGEALAAVLDAERDGQRLRARLASVEAFLHDDGWQVPALTLELVSSGAAPAVRLALSARIEGAPGEPAQRVALHVTDAHTELPHPAAAPTPLSVSFTGRAQFDAGTGGGEGDIAGTFDDSRFEGRWRFDPSATLPLEIGLTLDRLDLDRYLPPATTGADAADLAIWRNWPVRADLRVGELRVRGLVSTDGRLRLQGGEAATAP